MSALVIASLNLPHGTHIAPHWIANDPQVPAVVVAAHQARLLPARCGPWPHGWDTERVLIVESSPLLREHKDNVMRSRNSISLPTSGRTQPLSQITS